MSTGTLWISSFRQLNKPEQHKRRNELKQLDMNNRFLILAALMISVTSIVDLSAQWAVADTFYISVADKTAEHPYFGQGSERGYLINGTQSPTLTLVRDSMYVFDTENVPPDLVFEFYTEPIGGLRDNYREHVVEHFVSKGLWLVRPDYETPDTLYYACIEEPWMGGTILIVDSLTTSVEDRGGVVEAGELNSTIVPNPLVRDGAVRFTLAERSEVSLEIVDPVGRSVVRLDEQDMAPGERLLEFRMPDLSTGAYFYRLTVRAGQAPRVSTGTVRVE